MSQPYNTVLFFIIGLSSIHYVKASSDSKVSSEVEIEVNYRDVIDSETLIDYLNDRFEIPSDLKEQYGEFSPENSNLKYPDSTVAITSLVFIMGSTAGFMMGIAAQGSAIRGAVFTGFNTATGIVGATLYGLPGAVCFFGAGFPIACPVWKFFAFPGMRVTFTDVIDGVKQGLVLGAAIFIPTTLALRIPDSPYNKDSLYNFYYNRMEYSFTLRDQNNKTTPGSCLVHFAYNLSEHQWEYERDECYIQVLTGWEDAYLVKIPQTEEGRLRRGSWFDWFHGQTKVVDTGSIPTSNSTNSQITSD